MGLVADTIVNNLKGAADDDKGLRIYLPDQAFHLPDLHYGNNRVEYMLLTTGEPSVPFYYSNPAPDVLEDLPGNRLPLG